MYPFGKKNSKELAKTHAGIKGDRKELEQGPLSDAGVSGMLLWYSCNCSPSLHLLFIFPLIPFSDNPTVKLGWMGPRHQRITQDLQLSWCSSYLCDASQPFLVPTSAFQSAPCKMLCKSLLHLAQKDILVPLGSCVIRKALVKIVFLLFSCGLLCRLCT